MYSVHLTDRYPHAMGDTYIALAEKALQQQKDRKGHKTAIGYLKQLQKVGQEARALAIGVVDIRIDQRYSIN